MDPSKIQYLRDVDFPTPTKPTKFYVIAAVPRCGSTMLAQKMWKTGVLGAPDEYFGYHATMIRTATKLGAESLSMYVERLLNARTSSNGIFGMKAHPDQFRFFHEWTGWSRRFQPLSYIEILRSDRIAQAVSLVIARQTMQWNSRLPELRQPIYDTSAIDQQVLRIENDYDYWRQYFQKNCITPFTVNYEELCRNPDQTVARVADFLDVELPDPSEFLHLATFDKQSNPLKAEWIARYKSEKGLTA